MSQATTRQTDSYLVLSQRLESLLSLKKSIVTTDDINIILSSFRSNITIEAEEQRDKCVTLSHLLLLALYPAQPAPPLDRLNVLEKSLKDRLSGTDAKDLEEAFRGLSALLKVSPSVGINMMVGTPKLTAGSLRSQLEESVEFVARGEGTSNGRGRGPRIALVEMLSYAATHSETRKIVRRHAGEWLASLLRISEIGDEEDEMIRAVAGVAVVKLLLGNDKPSEDAKDEPTVQLGWSADDLVTFFREMAISASKRRGSSNAVLVTSLEALTYLMYSSSSDRKALLTTPSFLKILFTVLSTPSPTSPGPAPIAEEGLAFSVASLIASLSTYPVVETPGSSAEQLRRLRAVATAKSPHPATTTPPKVESTTSVDARNSLLLATSPSPLPTLVSLARSTSPQIRRLTSAAFLALAEQSKHRGQLIQGGVAKALLNVLRHVTLPLCQEDLAAIQALAKLLITTSPDLALGPTSQSQYLVDAINVLVLPLAINDEGDERLRGLLLLRFECMMALTNIASLDGALAEKIAGKNLLSGREESSTGGGGDQSHGRSLLLLVEELMVNDNTLVSRAATQLMCNLAFTNVGSAYYISSMEPGAEVTLRLSPRLRLLLTLASTAMGDALTRISAAGALAILLMESGPIATASLSLQLGHSADAMEKILGLIELKDSGEISLNERHKDDLQQRGYAILSSIAGGCEALSMTMKKAITLVFHEIKLEQRLTEVTNFEVAGTIQQLNAECRMAFKRLKY
jgi:hypothetical protein